MVPSGSYSKTSLPSASSGVSSLGLSSGQRASLFELAAFSKACGRPLCCGAAMLVWQKGISNNLPLIVLHILFRIGKRRAGIRLEDTHDLVDLIRVPGSSRQRLKVIIILDRIRAREDEDLDRIVIRRFQYPSRRRERSRRSDLGITIGQSIDDRVPLPILVGITINEARLHKVGPPKALWRDNGNSRAAQHALHPLIQGIAGVEAEVVGDGVVIDEAPIELAFSGRLLLDIRRLVLNSSGGCQGALGDCVGGKGRELSLGESGG